MSRWYAAAVYPTGALADAVWAHLEEFLGERRDAVNLRIQGMDDYGDCVVSIAQDIQTLPFETRSEIQRMLGGGTRRLIDHALVESIMDEYQKQLDAGGE